MQILVLIGLYFLKCTKFDQLILRKIIKIVATRCKILTLKMHQNRFRLGLRPRPRWGSLQRSPDPLAGFKGPTSKWREAWEGRWVGAREGRREGWVGAPLCEILNTPLRKCLLPQHPHNSPPATCVATPTAPRDPRQSLASPGDATSSTPGLAS